MHDAVRKSCRPHGWIDRATLAAVSSEATFIENVTDYDEAVFASTAGIYQNVVRKELDARVFLLGDTVHPYIIEYGQSILDCRSSLAQAKATMYKTKLPEGLIRALKKFVTVSGIRFGCADLCRTSSGEWWFLELNQAGQFLFVDDLLPENACSNPWFNF